MPKTKNDNAETSTVILPKTYKKYLCYAEQEQRKKYRNGIRTDDNCEPLNRYYLLPGIHIGEVGNDNKYIEVSVNQHTFHAALKAEQDVVLNVINLLKSISELSNSHAANKEKMAKTLQSALKRYLLLQPNKFENFKKSIHKNEFRLLAIGVFLSPAAGPAILLSVLVGIVTVRIHHFFSWNHRVKEAHETLKGAHETLVATVENVKQQIANSLFCYLSPRANTELSPTSSPDHRVRSPYHGPVLFSLIKGEEQRPLLEEQQSLANVPSFSSI